MGKCKLILMALPIVFITGCATIANGRYEYITVESTPKDAMCTLKNDRGTWQLITPKMIEVHRSKNPLTVTCHKPGFTSATKKLKSEMMPYILGNIIGGDIIGAGIDHSNRAAYRYTAYVELKLNANHEPSKYHHKP